MCHFEQLQKKLRHGVHFQSRNGCKCTAGCSTQRCPCKKNKIECTSHCHKGDINCKNKNCTPASAMKSSTPSYSNKTPFLDTQASLSCACKTRCNSAKYCCCKKNKSSCSARCHPGHSCTNGDHTLRPWWGLIVTINNFGTGIGDVADDH